MLVTAWVGSAAAPADCLLLEVFGKTSLVFEDEKEEHRESLEDGVDGEGGCFDRSVFITSLNVGSSPLIVSFLPSSKRN